MPLTQPVSRVLTDEELVGRVRWPTGLDAQTVRLILTQVTRYIDFDGTITDESIGSPHSGRIGGPRGTICGMPLAAFLAQEPFVIQTGGAEGAIPFFQRRPTLPQPLLIIAPPMISARTDDLWFDPAHVYPTFDGSAWLWKDLAALGIERGEVYDDWRGHVWAPGCTIIHDF